jgi:hypothetical protein
MNAFSHITRGWGVALKSIQMLFVLVALYFLLGVLSAAYGFVTQVDPSNPLVDARSVVLSLLGSLANTFFVALIQTGLIGYVRAHLETGESRLAEFWLTMRQFGLRVFGQQILMFVGLFLVLLVAAAIVGLLSQQNETIGQILAVLFLVPVAIVMGFLFFAPYFIVIHNESVWKSFGKSFGLVRRNKSAFFSTVLFFVIVVGVPFFVLTQWAFPWIETQAGVLAQGLNAVVMALLVIASVVAPLVLTGTYVDFYKERL